MKLTTAFAAVVRPPMGVPRLLSHRHHTIARGMRCQRPGCLGAPSVGLVNQGAISLRHFAEQTERKNDARAERPRFKGLVLLHAATPPSPPAAAEGKIITLWRQAVHGLVNRGAISPLRFVARGPSNRQPGSDLIV